LQDDGVIREALFLYEPSLKNGICAGYLIGYDDYDLLKRIFW